MGAKKGRNRGVGEEDAEAEEQKHERLRAILLADSFATKFHPITFERPKVLLPLVNAPMIDYTLAWLEWSGVEEVFVFCCAHSKQVIDYLENSEWICRPNFVVLIIASHNCISAGDALRLIYERNVISGDFILISGDIVSNMQLTQALKEHKERRRKDNNAVMTIVTKRSKPSRITNLSRLGTEELSMAIDPDTKQLLYYEDDADDRKGTTSLDEGLRKHLCNDMHDCYIDICSPEDLSLFTDNFDYQHLRRDFVKGLLVDDIMQYKIFTHEIRDYAARIDNYRSYDTVSKDIIQRWTYPFVPDVLFSGNCAIKHEREFIYRASDIELSRFARIGRCTVIGNGTSIGSNTEISGSVVGKDCVIGSNVSVEGCYILDNVTIEDGCKLKHAIVCDGVIMKSGAVLEHGVVLSFKVIVGQQFTVPAYSKVSLLQQPVKQDSDEELEYADNSSGIMGIPANSSISEKLNEQFSTKLSISQGQTGPEVGNGGVGFIWSVSERGHEEEWKHSVAPITANRLAEIRKIATEQENHDGNVVQPSGELEPDSSDNDSDEDVGDDYSYFEKEVEATFLRAVHENVEEDHVILEVNSLRLSYNLESRDCASALFYSIMKLALNTAHNTTRDLVKNVATVVTSWKSLLKYYLTSTDEEMEVILKFVEMCLESTKGYTPSFMQILKLLYDEDVLQEEAILKWAAEKEEAEESDKIFLKQAEQFITWLKEAEEEEEEEN